MQGEEEQDVPLPATSHWLGIRELLGCTWTLLPCLSWGCRATTHEFHPSCTHSRVLVNASQLLHSVIINVCSPWADPCCCPWMRCRSWVNVTARHWEGPSCSFPLCWAMLCYDHHAPPGACHIVQNIDSACSLGTKQFALPARLHWLIMGWTFL